MKQIQQWEDFPLIRRELARFTHKNTLYAVAFSADGSRVGTASADKTARLSPWMANELLSDLACSILPRKLTPTEWRQYLSDKPFHSTCLNFPVSQD